jgi:hypothetical protein
MKLPRLRFTMRRMLVVVAIVAALLASFEAGRRWERGASVGITLPSQSYLNDDLGPAVPTRLNPPTMPSTEVPKRE